MHTFLRPGTAGKKLTPIILVLALLFLVPFAYAAAEVNLTLPSNNSVSTTGTVRFYYSANDTINVSLYINGTINDSMISSVGSNSFDEKQFTSNSSIRWRVNSSGYHDLLLNLTSLPAIHQDALSLRECSAETGHVLLLWLLAAVSMAFVALGMYTRLGFIVFFGGILMLVTSWYISACFSLFGLIWALMALVILVWSIIGNIGFNNQTFS